MAELGENLKYALKYASWGWSVIPLHWIQNGQCTCKNGIKCISPGKHPRVGWAEYQKRRATDKEIREWWKKWPKANIGIVTGAISGIIVLDIDMPYGMQTIRKNKYALFPTPIVRTGGGGWHYIYKHPGCDCRNFAKKIGKTILPDVDFRGDGGLIVAPPSNHIDGGNYQWSIEPEL